MKLSSLVGHVMEVLDTIRASQAPADNILHSFFRKRKYLGSKDRRFISETLFGILRQHRVLQAHLATAAALTGVQEPDHSLAYVTAYCLRLGGLSRDALLIELSGLWQIQQPNIDIPAFWKAIAEYPLPEEITNSPTRRIGIENSFPDCIVAEWISSFGIARTEALCRALNTSAPTVLRVNTLKGTREACKEVLAAEGVSTGPASLSPHGLIAERRFHSQSLTSFKNGLFELQDEASQVISFLVDPQPGELVVDACAGAGGKSLHLAALMRDEGRIIAIEKDEQRLSHLRERARRNEIKIIETVLAGSFEKAVGKGEADRVLIDAPCTGSGAYRRNPDAKMRFTEGFLAQMNGLQRIVMEDYSTLVRRNGTLVYATCSLLSQENERIVEWFLKQHPEFVLVDVQRHLEKHELPIRTQSAYLALSPDIQNTDGFFAALFRRT